MMGRFCVLIPKRRIQVDEKYEYPKQTSFWYEEVVCLFFLLQRPLTFFNQGKGNPRSLNNLSDDASQLAKAKEQ